jgi:hypothetical protein
LINDEAKPDTERSPEEEAAGQNKVSEAKTETRIEAETSLQRPPNWTVRFPKLDSPVSQTGPFDFGSFRTEADVEDRQHLVGVLQPSCPNRRGRSGR